MRPAQLVPAMLSATVIAFLPASAHAVMCSGQINAPDADQPTDTSFSAINSDAKKRENFRRCPTTPLIQVADPKFKLGASSGQEPFSVAVKKYLAGGVGPDRLEVAAGAIHIQSLLASGGISQSQFESRWQQNWCETAHYPPNKPVEAPEAPDLERELLAMRSLSISLARKLAASQPTLPKTDCTAAVSDWLKRAKK